MLDEQKTVRLVKTYDRPELRTKPDKEDIKRADTNEIVFLRGQVSALSDRIRRLKEEILDEVRMLTEALEDDRQETIGQVRRRISRLKGALEYQGRSDYEER